MKFKDFLIKIDEDKDVAETYLQTLYNEGYYDIDINEFINNGHIEFDNIYCELYSLCHKRSSGDLAVLTRYHKEDIYEICINDNISISKIRYYLYYYLAYIDLLNFGEKKYYDNKANIVDRSIVISDKSFHKNYVNTNKLVKETEHKNKKLGMEIIMLKAELTDYINNLNKLEDTTINPIIIKFLNNNNIWFNSLNKQKKK